jgi:hypothetical protein
LAWDSTDLGEYTSTSTHKAYCTQMGWFINNTTSNANCNVCPVPVNFRQTGWGQPYPGVLEFSYRWDSSIGTLADLVVCTVGEYVTYPGGNPYQWPRPPWSETSPNPTVDPGVSGSEGLLTDNHLPGNMPPPYAVASFTATQKYRYSCTCRNNGSPVDIFGPLSIVRAVAQRPDGKYKYTVTKSGQSASIDALP